MHIVKKNLTIVMTGPRKNIYRINTQKKSKKVRENLQQSTWKFLRKQVRHHLANYLILMLSSLLSLTAATNENATFSTLKVHVAIESLPPILGGNLFSTEAIVVPLSSALYGKTQNPVASSTQDALVTFPPPSSGGLNLEAQKQAKQDNKSDAINVLFAKKNAATEISIVSRLNLLNFSHRNKMDETEFVNEDTKENLERLDKKRDTELFNNSRSKMSRSGIVTRETPNQEMQLRAEQEAAVAKWAPVLWLHPDELFFPGDVHTFLQHVQSSEGALTSEKDESSGRQYVILPEGSRSQAIHLVAPIDTECSNCPVPPFLYGKKPEHGRGPTVYAQINACNKPLHSHFKSQATATKSRQRGQVLYRAAKIRPLRRRLLRMPRNSERLRKTNYDPSQTGMAVSSVLQDKDLMGVSEEKQLTETSRGSNQKDHHLFSAENIHYEQINSDSFTEVHDNLYGTEQHPKVKISLKLQQVPELSQTENTVETLSNSHNEQNCLQLQDDALLQQRNKLIVSKKNKLLEEKAMTLQPIYSDSKKINKSKSVNKIGQIVDFTEENESLTGTLRTQLDLTTALPGGSNNQSNLFDEKGKIHVTTSTENILQENNVFDNESLPKNNNFKSVVQNRAIHTDNFQDLLMDENKVKFQFSRNNLHENAEKKIFEQNMPTKGHQFTVTYWFFYPYNRGKVVCTSMMWLIGRIAKPLYHGKCLGQNIVMGNHVGDWEHISILFQGGEPKYLYISAHNFGAYYIYRRRASETDSFFEYLENDVREGLPVSATYPEQLYLKDGRLHLYVAKGSHGLWPHNGRHAYNNMVVPLWDDTERGTAWDTALNINYIDGSDSFNNHKHNKDLDKQWLGFRGRWGNPSSNCHPGLLGFCELRNGPTGILSKRLNFPCNTSQQTTFSQKDKRGK